MKTEALFQAGLRNHRITNTAYPPEKTLWSPYSGLPDYTSWEQEEGLGLYVHIPFCKTRCRYCEYVTVPLKEPSMADQYINALLKEIAYYRENIDLAGKKIYGFDIGGGTPSLLDEKQMAFLLEGMAPLLQDLIPAEGYGQSIETNVESAIRKKGLLKLLREHGFNRISMGIQTLDKGLLKQMDREYQGSCDYEEAVTNMREAGFDTVNLDLMYGLPGQNPGVWEKGLLKVLELEPDQISLYETRYKESRLDNPAENRETLYTMYSIAYPILRERGYNGYFGSSAFSKKPGDWGLSPYLTKRTISFIPYIGLGAGAQSMTKEYLSYSYGKNSEDITGYIKQQNFHPEHFYKLPVSEILGKYIAIAFYLGFINKNTLEARMGFTFDKYYNNSLAFLRALNYINDEGEHITLTPEGFRHYHGIIGLFYSPEAAAYINSLQTD